MATVGARLPGRCGAPSTRRVATRSRNAGAPGATQRQQRHMAVADRSQDEGMLQQLKLFTTALLSGASISFADPALALELSATTVGGAVGEAAAEPSASPRMLVADAGNAQEVFFDIAVDNKPLGRIVVRLFDDVPVGTARFRELSKGLDGASFRRSKFDEITDAYVRNAGLKALTYQAEAETRLTGGADTFLLEQELDAGKHRHESAGVVSLVVRPEQELVVKEKLVAYQGNLVTVQEVLGDAPNGTAFVLTLRPAPELDHTHLPVGVVVEGQQVVAAMGELPVVKDNSSSPFFKAGKLVGDKRADVAERGFNRPFAKVVVKEAGLLQAPQLT